MKQLKLLFASARQLWATALLVLSSALPLFTALPAHADLGQASVRFDRMQISTATTGTVCAKPTTTATEADVQVTFPTGYTLGTAANFTVNTTNTAWPTGGTAWPSIATATNVTGQVVTFPSGDLTVGTLYCFNWANSAAELSSPARALATRAPSLPGPVHQPTSTAQATAPPALRATKSPSQLASRQRSRSRSAAPAMHSAP